MYFLRRFKGNFNMNKFRFNSEHRIQVFCFGFLIIGPRFLTFLAFKNGNLLPDSFSYRSDKFPDFSLLNFFGHADRGWPTPLIFSVLPNDSLRILFQLILSSLAAIWLIKEIIQLVSSKALKSLLVFCLSFLFSIPNIIEWDTTLLATSLLNSLLILNISAMLFYIRKKSYTSRFLVIIINYLILSIKISNIIIFIISIFLIFKGNLTLRRRSYLIAFSLILFVHSIVVGVNTDKNWQASYSGTTMLWHLGAQNSEAQKLKSFLVDKGIPNCVTQEAPFVDLTFSIHKILNECPLGLKYVRSDLKKDVVDFLMANPVSAAKLIELGVGALLTSSSNNYGQAISFTPGIFKSLFIGEVRPSFGELKVDDQVSAANLLKNETKIWITAPGLIWILFIFLFPILRQKNIFFEVDNRIRNLVILSFVYFLQIIFNSLLLPSEWVRQSFANLLVMYAISLTFLFILISEGISQNPYRRIEV